MNRLRRAEGLRVLTLAAALAAFAVSAPAQKLPVETLKTPPGFRVELVTAAVPEARALALGRFANGSGTVFVGSLGGNVYAVSLAAGRAAKVRTLASGLTLPAGVAYRNGSLWVSDLSRILRFDHVDDAGTGPAEPVVVTADLPSERHHGAKYIAFGPDGLLYVAVGAPCNICKPDARHGLIERMSADGGPVEVVATGVRNSVGFDWSPVDGKLWFTDNGRDRLGDDVPSDELNRLDRVGENFGYPYCHQGDLADPEFGHEHPCSEFAPPAAKLGAHVAALGMRFYRGGEFPDAWRGSIFIAEHGSWNRSRKVGYRVVRVDVDRSGHVERVKPFVEGWLQVDRDGRESVWGRPVDVLPLPDGSLLISDDHAGALYRVVRSAPAR